MTLLNSIIREQERQELRNSITRVGFLLVGLGAGGMAFGWWETSAITAWLVFAFDRR